MVYILFYGVLDSYIIDGKAEGDGVSVGPTYTGSQAAGGVAMWYKDFFNCLLERAPASEIP